MRNKKLFIYFFLFFLFKISNSYSLIQVDITRGNLDPLPIAVSSLSLDKKSKTNITHCFR